MIVFLKAESSWLLNCIVRVYKVLEAFIMMQTLQRSHVLRTEQSYFTLE